MKTTRRCGTCQHWWEGQCVWEPRLEPAPDWVEDGRPTRMASEGNDCAAWRGEVSE